MRHAASVGIVFHTDGQPREYRTDKDVRNVDDVVRRHPARTTTTTTSRQAWRRSFGTTGLHRQQVPLQGDGTRRSLDIATTTNNEYDERSPLGNARRRSPSIINPLDDVLLTTPFGTKLLPSRRQAMRAAEALGKFSKFAASQGGSRGRRWQGWMHGDDAVLLGHSESKLDKFRMLWGYPLRLVALVSVRAMQTPPPLPTPTTSSPVGTDT